MKVMYTSTLFTPARMTAGAAACDIRSTVRTIVWPGFTRRVPTGLCVALPSGTAGLILPRSGQACKRRLSPANSPGLIDSDYRGQLFVVLENRGWLPRLVEVGERVAQFMVIGASHIEWERAVDKKLPPTLRGGGGFGSTGR